MASYVLLTLLAVGLVGVLALSLIKRYVEQQEREYLAANAEAVARQASSLGRPVVQQSEEGSQREIVPRLMLPLIVAFDHRVVDGADAARFLRSIVESLEKPGRLLLAI